MPGADESLLLSVISVSRFRFDDLLNHSFVIVVIRVALHFHIGGAFLSLVI